MSNTRCPQQLIREHALGMLPNNRLRRQAELHLAGCQACRALLESEVRFSQSLRRELVVEAPGRFAAQIMAQLPQLNQAVRALNRRDLRLFLPMSAAMLLVSLVCIVWDEGWPRWQIIDSWLLGGFTLLSHTLQAGFKAALAVGQTLLALSGMTMLVLESLARLILALPPLWLVALFSIGLLTYFSLYRLLRRQAQEIAAG